MKYRRVEFVGTSPNGASQQIFIPVYKKGVDVKLITVKTGDVVLLDEDQFAKVTDLVYAGSVVILEEYDDSDTTGYYVGKEVAAGMANVWDNVNHVDQVATVTHNLGYTNYNVELSDMNYEVINKTTNSFQVRLSEGGKSAMDNIFYHIYEQVLAATPVKSPIY